MNAVKLCTKGNIKPIPKKMLKRLEMEDRKEHPTYDGHPRFLAYLDIWNKELVKVTVAMKDYKQKWYCKQVAVHGLDSTECIIKDIEYCGLVSMGFRVSWYYEGITHVEKWWDSPKWSYAADKYYNPEARIINIELMERLPEFKYSCCEQYPCFHFLEYLRLYRKYPQIEYLIKLGLIHLVTSKQILDKTSKDKKFCKWLIKNKEEIKNHRYHIRCILRSYKKGTKMADEQQREDILYENKDGSYAKFYKDYKENREELINYIIKQNTNMATYVDYYNACTYLKLDMSLEKNRLPHDFNYWHNMRIDQYAQKKIEEDKIRKAKMVKDFHNVAMKYINLEYNKKTDYIIIIAKSPNDLVHEGDILHHCVGKMNYDSKFIREQTLIFFVRTKAEPDTPLVTLEYDLKKHKILQCYAEHDSQPSEEIKQYTQKVWLPYANRQIKKIQQLSA